MSELTGTACVAAGQRKDQRQLRSKPPRPR